MTDTTRTADTSADAPPRAAELDPAERWRGVAAENTRDHEIDKSSSLFLRARSRRLLGSLLYPYRRLLWLLGVTVVAENLARLAIPWLVRRGIDKGIPPLMAGGSASALLTTVAAMFAALIIQAGCRIWFLRTSGRVGQEALIDLRRRVYRHFQRLDVAFHDRYTSGRVVSRMTSDMDAISELLAGGFDGLLTAVLTLLGTSVMLLVLDLRLGLICLASMLFVIVLLRWFSHQSTRTFRAVRERSAAVIVHFVETMTGIQAVEAYRRQPRNQEIFAHLADRYAAANVRSFRLFAVFMPGVKLIGNLTIGTVLLVGGFRVMHDTMTVGVLTAFLLYLRQFYEPMQDIGQFYNTFQSASSALEKLSGVLEEDPAVAEPTRPERLPHPAGRIDFDHVRFSYGTGDVVLPDLDLHLPAGQTVALVGTTGAGKTTIAKLISRFYDPTAGSVRLDGVDLRDIGDDNLRRAVILVTQENFMFAGSVAENIEFGRPGASREQIEAAARAVGADEFIRLLPEGLDTSVGKRGDRLSAGQRQLVAFARAFLADPAVLILDEATSSLDIPSERLVQRALQTLLADRTAVIIAHRSVDRRDRRPGARPRARADRRGRRSQRSRGRRGRPLRRAARGLAGIARLIRPFRPPWARWQGGDHEQQAEPQQQPPIGDYAILADRQTAPLLAHGSIDWLCVPQFDSAAVFSRLLGDPDGSHWSIVPTDGLERSRSYREGSFVLDTTWTTPTGAAVSTDFMPTREGNGEDPALDDTVTIVRSIECTEGEIDIDHELVIRFDFGLTAPWMRQARTDDGEHVLVAIAGPNSLALYGPRLQPHDRRHTGHFHISAGQRLTWTLMWRASYRPISTAPDMDAELERTLDHWREWHSSLSDDGVYSDAVNRSLAVLRALTLHRTGGIVAAVTTSLPEAIGGSATGTTATPGCGIPPSRSPRCRVTATTRSPGSGATGCCARSPATPTTCRSCTRSRGSGNFPNMSSSTCRATGVQDRCGSATERSTSTRPTSSGRCSSRWLVCATTGSTRTTSPGNSR